MCEYRHDVINEPEEIELIPDAERDDLVLYVTHESGSVRIFLEKAKAMNLLAQLAQLLE